MLTKTSTTERKVNLQVDIRKRGINMVYRPTLTTEQPTPPKGGSSADKSISKNRLCMYLADLQLSTDQYTLEGQTEWHLLEHLINTIKNW